MLLAIGGGLVLVLLIVRMMQGRGRNQRGGVRLDAAVARKAAAGNYDAAAHEALKQGDLETALEMYLRAQQPARAAQVAQRMGKPREAAELYEKAGDKERAAALFRQAGMAHRADELLPERRADLGGLAGVPGSGAGSGDDAGRAAAKRQAIDLDPPKLVTPAERARKLEDELRAALAAGATDAAGKAKLEALGNQCAEAWLALGDVKRAAEVCKDAGLIDQAVNLHVNLLGDFGSAAALLGGRGDHKRAAELYAQAGLKERALDAWISWSKSADDPLAHLGQVRELGDDALDTMAEAITKLRPLERDQRALDLHYRLAVALQGYQHASVAAPMLESISRLMPGYRDVEQRLQLARPPARAATPAAAAASAATAPAAAPAPVTPPAAAAAAVDRAELENLVAEAVSSAVARAVDRHAELVSKAVAARGIEREEVTLVLAQDTAVQAAKLGPSAGELEQMIAGKKADLGNIEVYYRMGLALMAAGRWDDARGAFSAVDYASPGYRDALKRAQELARWRQALAATQLGAAATADSPLPALAGGRYKLLGELGRGAMAVVYRAHDTTLEREVAIKFIADEGAKDELMRSFFEREARTAAALSHPNIVTVLDVGKLDGRPFICMELVEGNTVEQLMRTESRLKVLDALDIAAQVLTALEYAHGKRVVHRDIKPGNLMKTKQGLVKLMDFGIAKSIDATPSPTKATVVAGTPPYMAPEQLAGRAEPRSDLFAVGAALYEMLVGKTPFEGLRRDLPPAMVRTLNPAVPKLLESIVHRALEIDAEKRFANATEMLTPIKHVLATATRFVAKRSPAGTTVGQAPPPERPPPAPATPPAGGSATRTLRRS